MAFTRIGYGQVEPNQLSAQKTGQIYASLPLDKNVTVLQNGEFMYYDYATGKVTADGQGEPMLVFNEIKIYEDNLALKDFAMIRVGDNYVTNNAAVGRVTSKPIAADGTEADPYQGGARVAGANAYDSNGDPIVNVHTEYQYRMDGIAPRLFKTNVGDVYTTNMIDNTITITAGTTKLTPKKPSGGNTLVLTTADGTEDMLWIVAKEYTMPDGQKGYKLQRIK